MKRFSIAAPLLVGLSVWSLSCQRPAPSAANTAGANVANSTGGAQAGAQQPAAPQTQLKVGDRAPDFEQTNTQVLGISVDSFAANRRFKEDIGATFPLLSDFKRKAVRDYGIFDEEGGYGTRATFTVDKEGIIRHIEQGKSAIDPTGAYQSCNALGE